jgi:predicted HicB family RNase H-like nuclease
MSREKGTEPSRTFSGKFKVRLGPGDHATAAIAAAVEDKSLDERVAGAIRKAAESGSQAD